jgi:hypothetical protein
MGDCLWKREGKRLGVSITDLAAEISRDFSECKGLTSFLCLKLGIGDCRQKFEGKRLGPGVDDA